MRRLAIPSLLLLIAGAGATLTGCGGGGGGGGGGTAADVPVQATIATNTAGAGVDAATAITGVTVATLSGGDTFSIAGATARIERADGTSGPVALHINAARTMVSIGQAAVTPSATLLNRLIVDGPVGVNDGSTGLTTQIGRLEFAFEVLPGGVIVAPDTIRVNIPTRGRATDRKVTCTGLSANPKDYVKTIIIDNGGGRTESAVYGANSQGRAVIRDAQGGITANALSGPNSRITMLFARTDANRDGVPDLF